MENLKTIEVVDIGQIPVMAKQGRSIFVVGKECIELANLLQLSVKLYFNNKEIDIFTNTKLEDITRKL